MCLAMTTLSTNSSLTKTLTWPEFELPINAWSICVREIPSITLFGVSQEEMVNVCADLEDCFAKSKTVPGTRSSHHFVPISCNKIAHKLTSEDREFLQFDFDKLLTKEIDIKSISCFLYVSCIYNTFWWVRHSDWSECRWRWSEDWISSPKWTQENFQLAICCW